MKYVIKIKELEIPLCIKEYKTAKSIKIYFKEDVLTVTKSPYILKNQVDKLLQKNEQKIYEEYKKILEQKRLKKGKWENGRKTLYGGEEYTIMISYHPKDIVRVKLDKEEKRFTILLPEQIQNEEKEFYIEKAVGKLRKVNTEAVLQERLPYWSKKMNIPYESVKVRDAKTRYGSCVPAKRALHFTSRLVMLPKEAIDAIIVHELSHMIHPNHGKEFYQLVERYIPNYKQINQYLKNNAKKVNDEWK